MQALVVVCTYARRGGMSLRSFETFDSVEQAEAWVNANVVAGDMAFIVSGKLVKK